jgi:O-antigen/teichoic acid export membrane protein
MARTALLRSGALVVASTALWHCSNFAFNAVGARFLGPAQYGVLAASISLLYLVSPVIVSIQTVASREATASRAAGEWVQLRHRLRSVGARLGIAGAVAAAVLAGLSPQASKFLRIGSPLPVVLTALTLPLLVVTHLQRGVLQGIQRFGRYAASTITEAVSKLLAALLLFGLLWRNPAAGTLSVLVAAACGLVVNVALLRFLPKGKLEGGRAARTSSRYSATVLATLVLLALLMSEDVLVAKRYLDPHAAGLYAGVSIVGKIVFFATSTLSLILFPVFSARHEAGRDSRAGLAAALGLVAGGACLLALVFFTAPQLVLTTLLGGSFAAAEPYLGWMGIAFAFYAMTHLVATYLLAQRRADVVAILATAALLQVAGFWSFHGGILQLIHVLIATFAVAAVVLIGVALLRRPPAVTGLGERQVAASGFRGEPELSKVPAGGRG